MKLHKKHGDIVKPFGGKFHRNEFALIGAPCGIIQEFSKKIGFGLESKFKVGYVDASHGSDDKVDGFSSTYTDMINHHQVKFEAEDSEYQLRSLLGRNDLVLVNGNHFKAEKQVVIVNAKKEESLSRKLDRLTNVVAVIFDEGQNEVFDFLKDKVQDVPTFSITEIEKLTAFFVKEIETRKPVLKGLVLAGGKSLRMGQDKGGLDFHGKPQREHMADLLNEFCEEVYLSVRPNQNIESNYKLLEDTFLGMGPYGGILSAMKKDPNAAWFVVATDIPFVNKEALKKLVSYRNLSKTATCFHNEKTGFSEPLITIWEPRAYPTLLRFLGDGYNCPRKALINIEVEEIEVPNEKVFINVNTPEDLEKTKG